MQCRLTCSGRRGRGARLSAAATVITISVAAGTTPGSCFTPSTNDRRQGGRQRCSEVGVAGDRGSHGLQRRPVPGVHHPQRHRRRLWRHRRRRPVRSREAAVHRERHRGEGRRAVREQARGRRRRRVREVEGDGRERGGGGERGAHGGGRVGVRLEERRRRRDVVAREERAGVSAGGRAREEHGGRGRGGLGHRGGRWRQLVVVGALVRGDQHRLVLRAPLHLHTRVSISHSSCMFSSCILACTPAKQVESLGHFFRSSVLQVRCHDQCCLTVEESANVFREVTHRSW
jgi:hypothetical protein